MFFGDSAIDMLKDVTGEIGIVAGASIDRGGGTSPEEMRADRDAERPARGLG